MSPVKGWHRDCPSKESAWSLGTYALVGNPDGTVSCEACGASDLLPTQEAKDNALSKTWLREFKRRVKRGAT